MLLTPEAWTSELDYEMEARGFEVASYTKDEYSKAYALSWFKAKKVICRPEQLFSFGVSPKDAAEVLAKNFYGFPY